METIKKEFVFFTSPVIFIHSKNWAGDTYQLLTDNSEHYLSRSGFRRLLRNRKINNRHLIKYVKKTNEGDSPR